MTRRAVTDFPGRSLSASAHAKINLTLRVLGVRPDGYHELRTVFQSLALCDRLRFDVSRGPFRISSNDVSCPTGASNLVWRAAEQVWRASGRRGHPSGVHVHIHKRIPAQAGLGGGSSDAAAALRAFVALWCRQLEPPRLLAMAARLGADVPFFLQGGTALGLERGDRVFPLADWPATWVVIVRPAIGVSTTDAYRWLDDERAIRRRGVSPASPSPGRRSRSGGPYDEGGNDFQTVVERRHPVVRRLTAALRSAGADWAAMSGSGSAVFGLFSTRERAQAAARRVGAQMGAVLVTRTLTAREHRRHSACRDLPGMERIG